MIEDSDDPWRGAAGRHAGQRHGRWATPGGEGLLRLGPCEVAVLVEPDAVDAALAVAAHLAAALGATLLGVGAGGDGSAEAGWFRAAAARHPAVAGTWRGLGAGEPGDREGAGLAAALARHAVCADLLVTGGGATLRPEAVAAASGTPTLVVPPLLADSAVGGAALIAWDGGLPAARALRAALPLLRDARHVTVLEVAAGRAASRPGADAAVGLLERHGVQAFACTVDAAGDDVADAILRQAAGSGADLLVAGLSRHAGVLGRVLGGVGHELLARLPVATLVAA